MSTESISQVGAKLKAGRLLSSDLCSSCLRRVKHIEPLNAFVTVLSDHAAKRAEDSSARHRKGTSKGPLDGITVAVKDNFCMKGIPTTCCSRMLESFKAPYDATVVRKLEDAGAVIIGKCNMDEFAMGSGSVDSIFGPTKNVWQSGLKYRLHQKSPGGEASVDSFTGGGGSECGSMAKDSQDWFICGGSSGGSAVAVACGAAFAGIGSDTGGSTRNPAAYCGLVGLKPSYGLVSRHGLIPLVNSMDVPGILTRTVDDAAFLLDALAGCDPLDSTTVETHRLSASSQSEVDVTKITVGIPSEYHCAGLSAEVLQAWDSVADLLEDSGAKVVQVSMPHTPLSIACYSVLNQCEVASNMARYDGIEFGLRVDGSSTEELYASSRSAGFNDVVRGRILVGNYFLLQRWNYEKYFMQAQKVRSLIAQDFSEAWCSGVDVLLTPTTLTTAPRYSEFVSDDNRTQCATQDYCTQPANMAGLPAITVPVNLSKDGLPVSLQLMAPYLRDEFLLSVAKWLERRVSFPALQLLDQSTL